MTESGPLSSYPRIVLPSAQPMYEAARRWRDESLIGDRSLFSGQPVDGLSAAQELVRDFIDTPDMSSRDFVSKLRDQLASTSASGIQLAGELLYVHTLIMSTESFKGKNKRELINKVLAISDRGTTPVPDEFAEALLGGAARTGQAFGSFRWKMFAYLIRVYEAIKSRELVVREAALTDWQAFQDLLAGIDDQSVWTQRYALEHLLFPTLVAPVLSRNDRAEIVRAFTADQTGEAPHVHPLEPNVVYGDRYGVDLYFTPIREQWQGVSEGLGHYAIWARKLAVTIDLDHVERNYKLERVIRLLNVFKAAEISENPADAFRSAFSGYNVLDFRVADDFVNWIRDNPSVACEALLALAHNPGPESVDRFLAFVPREAAASLGSRLSIASALLMGLDPEQFPPWRSDPAETTRRLTGGYRAQESATAGEHYVMFLERLDAIKSAVNTEDDVLGDRLDTQGLAWSVAKVPVEDITLWSDAERAEFEAWRSGKPLPSTPAPEPPDAEPDPPTVISLEELAAKLHMSSSEWLQESLACLQEKRQLILQGPPGTGKTYIARALAHYLAGDPDRVVTVQFHPGTSYEDFVQGLRPNPADPSRFTVVDGPLMRISRKATADPGHLYVLLIDEINRGNVPAVFGELYYLLEYRGHAVTLLYGLEHSLPENLYIIATMNTADRSITTLDSALRRRFYVKDLDPMSDPLHGILQTFLEDKAPELIWLADLLDLANKQLNDPDLAIGPSHFMGDHVNETQARRAWEHSVLPTLRESFHSNLSRVESFGFDVLKSQILSPDESDNEAD